MPITSYPASCDFMVARPPTYAESQKHRANMSKINNQSTFLVTSTRKTNTHTCCSIQ